MTLTLENKMRYDPWGSGGKEQSQQIWQQIEQDFGLNWRTP